MAEDTEKRVLSIMEKLVPTPASSLSLPSSPPNTTAQKRRYSALEPKSRRDKVQTLPDESPQCRPWDRGDLFKRLATFKSMTWFAKPKVVDAISCARRGWVNVDMDIISCEVCGARLMFSTPSSWNRQQVEKAALVFSLKLDNGHKLLCPWIDNACDEALARFPPTPAPVLVDHYRERCSTLLQLLSLPKISSSAIENMKSPQLEHFLKQSIAVECGRGSNGSSSREYLEGDEDAVSAGVYYQALRLLSLCGWEPRQLPYMVDCGSQSKQTTYDAGSSAHSHARAGEQSTKLTVYHSASGEKGEKGENIERSTAHYDPNSAVLDCKLCGASIGLWTFLTVSLPLELVRVVGYTDMNGGDSIRNENSCIQISSDILKTRSAETMSMVHSEGLKLTIAGGPTPTKQNYKATISLPVIGRNLRARFSSELLGETHLGDEGFDQNPENSTLEEQTECGENRGEVSCNDGQCTGSGEDVGGVHQATTELDAQVTAGPGVGSNKNVGIAKGATMDGCHLQPTSDTVSAMKRSSGSTDNQTASASLDALQAPSGNTSVSPGTDINLRRPSLDKTMEFDPVKQHRHFCPWVTSADNSAPGWKQTLLALNKEKVFSLPDCDDPPLSPSLIKVDDPITSIRNLFRSPPAKRMKSTHG